MLTTRLAIRARREQGIYYATDWEQYLLDHGYQWCELPNMPVPAFRCGRFFFLDRDLCMVEKTWWAWHEIAHSVLHVGSSRWWQSRPQGDITVSKFEQQAAEFVLL